MILDQSTQYLESQKSFDAKFPHGIASKHSDMKVRKPSRSSFSSQSGGCLTLTSCFGHIICKLSCDAMNHDLNHHGFNSGKTSKQGFRCIVHKLLKQLLFRHATKQVHKWQHFMIFFTVGLKNFNPTETQKVNKEENRELHKFSECCSSSFCLKSK